MDDSDDLQKTLLTPGEASALLNVPLRTIYFWYRTGNIKGINVNGRCLRIFSTSVKELLRSSVTMRSKKISEGRRRKAEAERTAALPARQGGQAVQLYNGDGQDEMSQGGKVPGDNGGSHAELTPFEMEMLRSLVKRAGVPGYHDWASIGLGPEP